MMILQKVLPLIFIDSFCNSEEMQIILISVGKLIKVNAKDDEEKEEEEEVEVDGEEMLKRVSMVEFDYMSSDFKMGMRDMQIFFPEEYNKAFTQVPIQIEEKDEECVQEVE